MFVPIESQLNISNDTALNLTACWLLESDSFYTTYERAAAAVDLGINHANDLILPSNIRLRLFTQRTGPSCIETP